MDHIPYKKEAALLGGFCERKQLLAYFRRRKINSAAAPSPARAMLVGSGTTAPPVSAKPVWMPVVPPKMFRFGSVPVPLKPPDWPVPSADMPKKPVVGTVVIHEGLNAAPRLGPSQRLQSHGQCQQPSQPPGC